MWQFLLMKKYVSEYWVYKKYIWYHSETWQIFRAWLTACQHVHGSLEFYKKFCLDWKWSYICIVLVNWRWIWCIKTNTSLGCWRPTSTLPFCLSSFRVQGEHTCCVSSSKSITTAKLKVKGAFNVRQRLRNATLVTYVKQYWIGVWTYMSSRGVDRRTVWSIKC